jgi:hypothetical protein
MLRTTVRSIKTKNRLKFTPLDASHRHANKVFSIDFYACPPDFIKQSGIVGVAGNYVWFDAYVHLAL